MYNNIADIDREIAALREQRDCTIAYWFEMGEADRSAYLPPQYLDNQWYLLGYYDRDYQLEIGFTPETPSFNHF
ncbi:hypothetical protein I8748_20140 [Nostoc sp. CENA67]|uniref:Uncharacterized protein n=1 Tax=Amazonocrinis nigriterrae CENA67 TaxID=2794033 RepID=A0A8J7HXX7_9NOST|nr:hypothetical protein [Amazonocrinis nigriterrae]MBH8564464.1 hypothetical protein [Amazonocrinis nigriterrae CENA67]